MEINLKMSIYQEIFIKEENNLRINQKLMYKVINNNKNCKIKIFSKIHKKLKIKYLQKLLWQMSNKCNK